MTHVIYARNVNDALWHGLRHLRLNGLVSGSRNGKVRVAPGPVVTEYARPNERVLFWPERDANPFFHIAEAFWMLAGRNDVEFPTSFNKQMASYSDDGKRFNGAYGYRWRRHWEFDQIAHVANILRSDPLSRRAVIQIYDPRTDSDGGKDIPCNTVVYFSINNDDGELDMTVSNRSNDIIWGAYGANAVHFGFLQEIIASMLKLEVGKYRQFSNNFHIYEPHWVFMEMASAIQCPTTYDHVVVPFDLPDGYEVFTRVLDMLLVNPPTYIPVDGSKFLAKVLRPMLCAYMARKKGFSDGKDFLQEMPDCDWRHAGIQWIRRREEYALRAAVAVPGSGVH